MKILFVRRGIYPGTEFPEARQFAEIVRSGHEAEILCLNDGNEPSQQTINRVVVYRIAPNRALYRLLFPILVVKFLWKRSYDVIHIFWGKGLSLAPILTRKSAKLWIDDVRSGHIGSPISSKLINLFIVLESFFFDRILTLDIRLYKKIWGNLPFKKKVYFVPMGVDTKLFTRHYEPKLVSYLGLKQSDEVFIYVGTLAKSRQMGKFIEAFGIASKKIANLKLVMVGDGNDKENLQRLVEKLGLEEQVKFIGPVLFEDVSKYMSIGNFGVSYVPQTHAFENQQVTKTLEYLFCGLPVLGTRLPFHQEVIGTEQGILTDDSPIEVASGILKIVELSQKGLFKKGSKANEKYSWFHIVNHNLLPAYQL